MGQSDLTAHQLLSVPADDEERSALAEAKEILGDLLSRGPMTPTEIRATTAQAGVKEATLRRAKDALGVRSVKLGFGTEGQWVWELRRSRNTMGTLAGSDRAEPRLSKEPRLSNAPDSCLTCGAEATYYAPNGKPFCEEHRLDRGLS